MLCENRWLHNYCDVISSDVIFYKDPRLFTKCALLQLQYNLTKSLTSTCIRSIFYLMLNYLKLNYLITPLRYSYHFRKASIFWLMKSLILMKSLKVPILNFIYPGKVSNTKRKKQIDTNLMFNTLAFWRHDTYFVTNLLFDATGLFLYSPESTRNR